MKLIIRDLALLSQGRWLPAVAMAAFCLSIPVPAFSQGAVSGYGSGPCTFNIVRNLNPDDLLVLDLTESKVILLSKLKTFVRRHSPNSLEWTLDNFDEAYQKCVEVTTGDGMLGLLSLRPTLATRMTVAAARLMIRPTGQWVVADFNRDGLADSVVPSGNSLFVQLALASGELGAQQRQALGPSTHGYSAAAAADLNSDGRQDLVLCCSGFGPVSRLVVSLGNGDGTFQAPVESVPAMGSFALTDWNGDGRSDVVTATPSGTITTAIGQANGTFAVDRTVTASGQVLVVGDFTGDSRADVLALSGTEVAILPGQSDGSLGAAIASELPFSNPRTLVAADFNRDGVLDAAIFDPPTGVMAMLMGEAGGRFRLTGLIGTMRLEGAAAADLDSDGLLELMLPNPGAGTMTVVPISSSGALGGSPLYRVSPTSAVDAAAVADFDGDQRADLALGAQINGQATVRVYRGARPISRLTPAEPLSVRTTTGSVRIAALAAADIDGDSRVDLAVLDSAGRSLMVLRGKGDGTFETGAATAIGATQVNNLVVGDLNGDSRPDVAVSGTGGIRIFFASGNGSFSSPSVVASAFNPNHMAVGDLNGDGRPDVAFTTTSNQQGIAQAGVVLNEGNGTFGSAQELQLPSNTGIGSIAVADLDGDRRSDVLLGASFLSGGNFYSLAVFMAGAGGSFTALPLQREIDFGPQSLLMTDLNVDGKLDLIAAHCCGELATRLYLGRGDGTFSRAGIIATAQDTTRLWLADVDGNGVPELVAQNPSGVSLTPFRLSPATPAARTSETARELVRNDVGRIGLLLTEPSGLLAANVVRLMPDGSERSEALFVRGPGGVPSFVPLDVGAEGETVSVVIYASGIRGRHDIRNVRVVVGGISLPVEFAGHRSVLGGLDAVKFTMPRALAGRRSVDVVLIAGDETSNAGRIMIR